MKTYKNTNKIYKKNRNVRQSCAIFFERSTRTRRIRRTGKCGGKKNQLIVENSPVISACSRFFYHSASCQSKKSERENFQRKIPRKSDDKSGKIEPGTCRSVECFLGNYGQKYIRISIRIIRISRLRLSHARKILLNIIMEYSMLNKTVLRLCILSLCSESGSCNS